MNKMRQLWVLTSVVVVAVLAAGYFLAVSPKKKEVAKLDTQAQQQRTANTKIQGEINRLIDQRRTLPAKQARLAEIAKNIPSTPALPTLVRTLSKASKKTGMALEKLEPSELVFVTESASAAAPAKPGAAAAAPAAPVGGLAIMPVKVTVWGTYAEVQEFLAELEGLKRTLLVTKADLEFQPATAVTEFGQPGDLMITLETRVYMRTTNTAAAPKPVAKPAASTTSE